MVQTSGHEVGAGTQPKAFAGGTAQSCTVHFGLHKTGSSSIQSFLSSSSQRNVFYPALGEANQSRPLCTAFQRDASDYHLNRKSGVDARTLARRARATRHRLEVALTSPSALRKVVLSAEDLSLLPEQDLGDFFRFVGERTTSIESLAYVRGVGSWLESLFQESLRNSRGLPSLGQGQPLYRPRLEKFDTVLGRSHVHLIPFCPDLFPNKCVVHDFAARIGAEPPRRLLPRRNTSLSLPAARLMAVYKKWRPSPLPTEPESLRENRILTELLRELHGEPLRFAKSFVDEFISRTRADIDWAEERLGAVLTETTPAGNTVKCQADLLRLQPAETEWLAEQCGLASSSLVASSPDSVAQAMRQLVTRQTNRSNWLSFSRKLGTKLSRLFQP